jgi:tetratricopeptide (TPR) repeat protein
MALNNLAISYLRQGKYELVEPLSQRALTIYEQCLGSEHPETAKSLNNLANLYLMQGKYDQAKALYQRALAIREKRLGPTHPETQNTRKNYSTCLRMLERDAEVTPLETDHKPSAE